MATSTTYSITADDTRAHLGQYVHSDAAYPVTPPRFTVLLEEAAADVNGELLAALDLSSLDPITEDTASVAYHKAKGLVTRLCAAYVLRSALGQDVELAKTLEDGVYKALERIHRRPTILGLSAAQSGPRVSTVVDRLNLDTSDAARAERRHFDRLGKRTSGVTDDHMW